MSKFDVQIFHHDPQEGELWEVHDPFYSVWMADDPRIVVLIIKVINSQKVLVLNPKGLEEMWLWTFNKDAKKLI